ncbi:MAG: sulfite exporter TauE/SafE family protein [Fimbriimonadaceae bacterium]|nr:sulfite exporter TauE/SafE family protein [Fimbriimonadaceae bacterium]
MISLPPLEGVAGVLSLIGALLMGGLLGVMGGGGSIMSVPIFVYGFGIAATTATGPSLLVVGATAAAGALNAHRRGLVHWQKAIPFVLGATPMAVLMKSVVVPALPDQWGPITKDQGILVIFSFLMLASGRSMIWPPKSAQHEAPRPDRILVSLALGASVGALAGLVGAGGGLLAVPALVLICGLDMPEAVGTSLVIIAIQSLAAGGSSWPSLTPEIRGACLLTLAIAFVGMFVGQSVAKNWKPAGLRKGFGIFIWIAGTAILIKEILFS